MSRRTDRGRRRGIASGRALALVLGVVAVVALVAWQGISGTVRLPERAPDEHSTAAAYRTTDAVNLRSGPSTAAGILDVLAPQTTVTVTGGQQQGFLPVEVSGNAAWIAVDYLVREGDGHVASGSSLTSSSVAETLVRSGLVESVSAAEADAVLDDSLDSDQEPEPDVAPPIQEPAPIAPEPAVAPTEPVTIAAEVTEEAAPTEPGLEPVMAETNDAPASEPGKRWIEVDRSTAMVTLHEGDAVVATYQGKIGKDPSPDGYYSTAVGTFHVYMMNKELAETPFVEGVYLTDFVGFDPDRSNGFHSPVRDAEGNVVNTQGTTTLGCVRLEADDAEALFAFAHIGMRVEIHD